MDKYVQILQAIIDTVCMVGGRHQHNSHVFVCLSVTTIESGCNEPDALPATQPTASKH